jgi:SRSO17 transposase
MLTHLFSSTSKRAETNSTHAKNYLRGLLSETQRKNSEAIADGIDGANVQDLQNFIADSKWDDAGVFAHVARQVNERIGNHRNAMLTLDESGFSKKGKHSAGVTRQYNGRLGKTDNCQVGVFSVLSNGPDAALIGARLFLPEEWVADPDRCQKAGIPAGQIKSLSKINLARELIEQADAHGVIYARIGMDSFYGRDSNLLCWIEDRGREFYADIPENLHIWLSPPPLGDKRPTSPAKHGALKVSEFASRQVAKFNSAPIQIRTAENGPVMVQVMAQRIWAWPTGEGETPREWWLIISKDSGGIIKYTFSNAPAVTPLQELAEQQGQRHFIERTFQNSKSHLGMADYQVRKWQAWHRHMAMVALAGLFVMEERMLNRKEKPLLSTRDIVQILDWYFCTRPNIETVMREIENRHRRREVAAKSKLEKSRKKIPISVTL